MFDRLAELVVYDVLRFEPGSVVGDAVHFFVMDTAKIFVLLAVVITLVSYGRSYFPATRSRRLLAGRRHVGHVLAALLGIVTPFCSCSAVPMFIGFIEAGIPLGVTMTFLIASPAINEVAIALLFGLFGWKVTALYIGSGFVIAVVGGFLIGALKLERYVAEYVWDIRFGEIEEERPSQRERIVQAFAHMRHILAKIWIYVVIGIGVGAAIHGYVPEGFIAQYLGKGSWWSVPAAVAIGVPLYGNAGSTLPAIQALIAKGVPLGTALALMMSITAISLPELILLKRVLKVPLLTIFVGIVALAIMIVGFLFNAIL